MASTYLYHGTSIRAALRILQHGRILLPEYGNAVISTSPDRSVSEYWADLQAQCDEREAVGGRAGKMLEASLGSRGAIFTLSRSGLLAAGLRPTEFSDPCWGEGECDWEQEEAIDGEIPLTPDILVMVEFDEAIAATLKAELFTDPQLA